MDLKDRLRGILTEEELAQVPTSFDIIGDIAIIKVPAELEHRTAEIADAVMQQHNHVQTVLRKTGERSGPYRLADYETVQGTSTETIHREHGCRFKLDPTQVYFSERLGHERERIMKQAAAGETVIDMFAGVGPFTILLARNADVAIVHAIELNPAAAAYLRENIALNNVTDRVRVYEGDAAEILPATDIMADRIIMNLPEAAADHVPLAVDHCRPGGTVHLYQFIPKDKLWTAAEQETTALFRDAGADITITDRVICGHYNPAVERVCMDVRIDQKL